MNANILGPRLPVHNDRSSLITATEETLWPRPTDGPSDEASKAADDDHMSGDNDPKTTTETAVGTDESIIHATMNSKTDSGKTVTIPNDEVVTVTKHTLIVTDKKPSSTFETSTTLLPSSSTGQEFTPTPTPTGIGEDYSAPDGSNGPPLSTGGFVGVGIAGAALIGAVIAATYFIKRYRRKARERRDAIFFDDGYGRDDLVEEKHFPQQVSAQSTGTGGGEDPFAPFGGRADRSESDYPKRPPNNTFEMDATSAVPIELPDTSPPAPKKEASPVRQPFPVTPSGPADPRANLHSLGQDDGQPRYINHWNQYKAMSGE